ncbi:MAG: response regulator [Desulfobacterales bacterium]|nr:response regulator [Desulfobacterales bacterium]
MSKILVIDDSSTIRKMVQYSLQPKGHTMVLAEDGVDGFEKLEEEEEGFDIIILDINMPRMDGLEFLKKIQQSPSYSSIPVIILTTEGQNADKDKAFKLGAKGYFVKPFKPNELLQGIEKILKG